jgi:4-amino-4-deoxy-L-arabinose transferase-like glycosyltransferase
MPRARLAVSPCAVLRRRRPPGPLAALLGIVMIVGLCWALTVPPWQSPDELSHYAYVESLATSFRLPGNAHRAIFSSDQTIAINQVDASNGAFHPRTVPPSWTRGPYERYLHSSQTRTAAKRSNGGGPSSASGNPPLYYLVGAVGYLLDGGGTAYGRLYGIRLEGVVFLLATALGAWLLAGETFGRRRVTQLVVAATTALLPMVAFMSTSVNPDGLIITEWTFALWLAARIVNRGAQLRDVAWTCALLGASILTKDNSYALLPPIALAVAIGVRRRPSGSRLRMLPRLCGAALLTIVPVGAWLAISRSVGGTAISQVGTAGRPFNIRQFLSYLWQFYLPRLPFMRSFRLVRGIPAVTVWVDEGAGNFGWLSVPLPDWMLECAKAIILVVSIGSVWFLTRLRDGRRLGLFAVDLLALLGLLLLVHVTEYRQTLSGGGAFLQGRYILPVVSLLGLAVGLLLTRLPRPARSAAAALVLAGLLGTQALSLATVVHAYYL